MFHMSDYQELVLKAGYALIFLSVFIFARMLLSEQENMSAQENLRELDGKKTSNALVRFTRPFFSQYIVPAIRGRARFNETRTKYRRKIISGGLKDELTADEFIAFKILLIVVFPMIGGFIRALNLYDADVGDLYFASGRILLSRFLGAQSDPNSSQIGDQILAICGRFVGTFDRSWA
jgi:CRISPR/Cas system-associated protein endoribonuclease Cas2